MEYSIKNIQKTELELLEQVKLICTKHNIHYFADSGTLLGVVRNNSFIPWDDDIDLVMLRKDYKKFIKYAKKELKEPYYLQTAYRDKNYYDGLIKIRKTDTTAIIKTQFPQKKYNQGLFLDIFPLDTVIQNDKILKHQIRVLFGLKTLLKFHEYKKISVFKRKKTRIIGTIFYPLLVLLPQSFYYRIFECVGRIGNLTKSPYVDKILFRGYTKNKNVKMINKSCYNYQEEKSVAFEGTSIIIPSNYHEILTKLYDADYMTPKQGGSEHGTIHFDLEHSYKEYLNGNLKFD